MLPGCSNLDCRLAGWAAVPIDWLGAASLAGWVHKYGWLYMCIVADWLWCWPAILGAAGCGTSFETVLSIVVYRSTKTNINYALGTKR